MSWSPTGLQPNRRVLAGVSTAPSVGACSRSGSRRAGPSAIRLNETAPRTFATARLELSRRPPSGRRLPVAGQAQLGCWDRIAANLAGLQDQIVQARLRLPRDHLQQNPPRACTEP